MFGTIDPATVGLGLILLLLAGGLAGLGREFARLRALKTARRPSLESFAPADGRVGVAKLAGARGVPNRVDPKARRFDGWESVPGAKRARRGAEVPPLLGRVVLVSMFLGRDGRDWSDAEIAEAYKALVRAGEWVGRQAVAWEVPLRIDLADAYFRALDGRPRGEVEVEFATAGQESELFEAAAEVKEMAAFSGAAATLGFADGADLAAKVAGAVEGGSEAIVWLLHARSQGHSFVIGPRQAPPGASLAVCYAREADFPAPLVGPPAHDPATIVHELLHLFGATDKYNVPLASFPKGAATERDIMRMGFESLGRLRVDPLTALEVGWSVALRAETPAEVPSRGQRRA